MYVSMNMCVCVSVNLHSSLWFLLKYFYLFVSQVTPFGLFRFRN